MDSPAYASFLQFLGGEHPASEHALDAIMQELDRQGAGWMTSLHADARFVANGNHFILGKRFLTLGPLEGGLEWYIARNGATRVVGVEGYHLNYLKCRALQLAFPELPLEFVECDVDAYEFTPEFDVVLCFGLLYHLAQPQRLIETLYKLRPITVAINTQLATPDNHPGTSRWRLGADTHVTLAGRTYRGRPYPEQRVEDDYHSGLVDGRHSFWFFPEELTRLAVDVGFTVESTHIEDRGDDGLLGAFLLSTSAG